MGRQRELRAAVVHELRVQEEIVLAFVAPSAGSRGDGPGRAAPCPSGPERRARVHSRSARLAWTLLPGRVAGPAGTWCEGPRHLPTDPRQTAALGRRSGHGRWYPAVWAPRGVPRGPGRSHYLKRHRGSRSWTRAATRTSPGAAGAGQSAQAERREAAQSRDPDPELLCQPETLQPSAPAFLPASSVTIPTFKGIGVTC